MSSVSTNWGLTLIVFLLPWIECAINKPIIIAHRGASGYLPEHTLENKAASFIMDADYIEQDVVLTKDFVPIVLHDIYLDGVSDVAEKYPNRKRPNSRFYAIDFTFQEIKTLKATERFGYQNSNQPVYPNRFPIWKSYFQLNSLEEEIELIQGMQKSFNAIYSLDKSKLLSKNKVFNVGIHVEIKNPDFHKNEEYERNCLEHFEQIWVLKKKRQNYYSMLRTNGVKTNKDAFKGKLHLGSIA